MIGGMERFEALWWVPPVPDDDIGGIGGTLEVAADGGLELDLLGVFPLDEEAGETERDLEQPYPVVFGVTPAGKRITLAECRYRGHHMSIMGGGFPTMRLVPRIALIGNDHVPDPFGVKFTSAQV